MSCVPITRALLDEREREVGAYLKFLEAALERGAFISVDDGGLKLLLDRELCHTLKANTLLLLYSAMEATLVQLLDEMHEAIDSHCSSADTLNGALLELVVRTFKDSKSTQSPLAAPLHYSLFRAWISDWKNRSKPKDKRVGGISGSVDGQVFYQQLKRFGVVATPDNKPPAHLTHHALQRVKDRRNELAHGESSFTDRGRDLALQELQDDARHVFATLRAIAQEVNAYLASGGYLAAAPAATAGSEA